MTFPHNTVVMEKGKLNKTKIASTRVKTNLPLTDLRQSVCFDVSRYTNRKYSGIPEK